MGNSIWPRVLKVKKTMTPNGNVADAFRKLAPGATAEEIAAVLTPHSPFVVHKEAFHELQRYQAHLDNPQRRKGYPVLRSRVEYIGAHVYHCTLHPTKGWRRECVGRIAP